MTSSIRVDAIRKAPEGQPSRFGPFTSLITASSLLGISLGIFSIVVDKF
jgi:hypothetical protein